MLRVLLISLLLFCAGCSWLRPQPTPILPAEELYQLGEAELDKKRYSEAREQFRKVVEQYYRSLSKGPEAGKPKP